jgi:excisionase family DNA binding protein
MDKLLTVKELAKLLGVAEGSIYHWISQGRLSVIRLSKRCVRFRESDLQNLLDSLKVEAVAERPSGPAIRSAISRTPSAQRKS